MKCCSFCKQIKPIGEFYGLKNAKDGLRPNCKDCHREYVRQQYRANRKSRKATVRSRNQASFEAREHRNAIARASYHRRRASNLTKEIQA